MSHRWRFPLVFSALAAFAAVVAGCLSSPDGSAVEQSKYPVLSMPEAYFILTAADIRSEHWPDSWASFDVFVCTPEIPLERITQARIDRPDAIFLGYTNTADIRVGLHQSPYWVSLDAVFDTSLCVRDMLLDEVIRLAPTGEPGMGVPCYVMQQRSADILVAFHRDVTMAHGFNGLYLDNCTAVVPPWRLDAFFEAAPMVDVNGDDKPDGRASIMQTYATWRPYYTQQLREAVGDNVFLVGNSGGPLGDPVLNGITLEGVGDRFEVQSARDYYDEQRTVGRLPFLSVAWVTTPESELPTLDFVPGTPGLHYGYMAR